MSWVIVGWVPPSSALFDKQSIRLIPSRPQPGRHRLNFFSALDVNACFRSLRLSSYGIEGRLMVSRSAFVRAVLLYEPMKLYFLAHY